MVMNQKTRASVAVVGVGYIGNAHIAAILETPGLALSAIVDPSEAGRQTAMQQGVAYFADLSELLAHAAPDAVVLATPNALHVEQALRCAQAGVAILLEKPVAVTAVEGQRLLAGLGGHVSRVLVGHHRAHSPIMQEATACVTSGALGRLVCVTGSATFFKPDGYFSDAPWRSQLGAGPILLNMIHEVHNLRMLCGEIRSVQAMVSHATRGFVVEDTAAMTFEFVNGVLGTFVLSDCAASPRSWEQTSQENKAYTDAVLRRNSESKLRDTQARYTEMLKSMQESEASMQPVLASLYDNVLYLKHNLNAQAVGSLRTTFDELEGDIDILVERMNQSIARSNDFIAQMN